MKEQEPRTENKEKDRYKPLDKMRTVFQKGDKTLIIGEKETTFQTNDKILKRKRG